MKDQIFATASWLAALSLGSAAMAQCDTELGQLLGQPGEAQQFVGFNGLDISGETIVMSAGGVNVGIGAYEAVHIFNGSGGSWSNTPDQRLFQSSFSTDLPSQFGFAVDVRSDQLAVGSPSWSGFGAPDTWKGQLVMYRRNPGGSFFFEQLIYGPTPQQNQRFGQALASSEYGEVFVSAPFRDLGAGATGAVWGYKKNGATWTLNRGIASQPAVGGGPSVNGEFGASLACDGDWLVVGQPKNGPGRAHVYYIGPGPIQPLTTLTVPGLGNSAEFGHDVAIAGDWIAVTTRGLSSDIVYLYQRTNGVWPTTPTQVISEPSVSFASVDMDGERLVVGAPFEGSTGSVRRYDLVGSAWTLGATLVANNPVLGEVLGTNVAIDGLTGVFNDGTADGIPGQVNFQQGVNHVFALDGPLGENYCGGTTANSTGLPGALIGMGSDYASVGCLNLVGTQLPPFAFGQFIMSSTQDFVPNVGGGLGDLCLGSPFIRLDVVQADAAGQAVLPLDFSGSSSGAAILSGSAWNFQLWHRDAVGSTATSNTTNAIEVSFK